jgi:predicted dinucleotide-binding enzyme
MATITIIGTGTMGSAVAGVATKAGHTVQQLSSQDGAVAVEGDLVVLAVPYAALSAIVAERGESLAGKVVVDLTNPVDFTTMDGLTVAADGSAAAELAAALPQSRVVKAFNTNFGSTLVSGAVGPLPTTVLVAGDDDAAKAAVIGLVTSAGLNGIDAGSLKRARELEALAFLQISLAVREQVSWTGGFAVQA